ncbi:MAG: type II toxin-antitoxin system VapC family toxin [Solirubrobacterales bacterium]
MVYFDSSALAKLMLPEDGSDWARACWAQSEARLASSLAYVEVRAALAAARRSGRLTKALHVRAKREFESIWERIDECEPTIEVIAAAAGLAELHSLRGYDAVHLATSVHEYRHEPLFMLTWDQHLARASHDAGVNVIHTHDA